MKAISKLLTLFFLLVLFQACNHENSSTITKSMSFPEQFQGPENNNGAPRPKEGEQEGERGSNAKNKRRRSRRRPNKPRSQGTNDGVKTNTNDQ